MVCRCFIDSLRCLVDVSVLQYRMIRKPDATRAMRRHTALRKNAGSEDIGASGYRDIGISGYRDIGTSLNRCIRHVLSTGTSACATHDTAERSKGTCRCVGTAARRSGHGLSQGSRNRKAPAPRCSSVPGPSGPGHQVKPSGQAIRSSHQVKPSGQAIRPGRRTVRRVSARPHQLPAFSKVKCPSRKSTGMVSFGA